MKIKTFLGLSFFMAVLACAETEESPDTNSDQGGADPTEISTTISIDCNRPGNEDEITIKSWTKGQTIRIGEYISKPLTKISGTIAEFEFVEKFSRPFSVITPESAYVDASKVKISSVDPEVGYVAYVGKGVDSN